MKKTIIKIWIFLALFAPFSMAFTGIACAQSVKDIDPSSVLQQTEQQLKTGGKPIELINPAFHAESSVDEGDEGTTEITSTIWYLIDYIKYFMQGVAILVLIVGGVMFLTGGKDQKKIDDAKRTITYSIFALVIITLGGIFVKQVFFGEYGDALSSQGFAESFGKQGSLMIKKLYEILEIFIGAIAVLMIIINGIRISMAFGDQEAKNKGIKRILYALGGLLLIGISEFAVKGILFPAQGQKLMAGDQALLLIKGITNFLSAFVAITAFIMLLYSGYMYVIAGADPDSAQKAKKILFGSITGLILAAGAYAIVNTLIKLG